ncbi:MAG: VCBS repeat-containing protein [Chthoniobacterales bacterium]|nr:VCBS repeat-containing protein [Chthoniobacterales bacterium]
MNFPRTAALLCLAASTVHAEKPAAPPPPVRTVLNGGFERSFQSPNLWSGIDKDGNLAGFRTQMPVLNESGNIADTPLPISPAIGDLNGDNLPDILASDPVGYIRIYFNSGTATEPKFTFGELTMPYLALREGQPPWTLPTFGGVEAGRWGYLWVNRRKGVSVALADNGNAGKLDLVAGTYNGEIFLIPNTGSAKAPLFAQPQSLAKANLKLTKNPDSRWGNVFAPLMYDWDGDKKPDLLVGEGSYSANNVHLFLNSGTALAPMFSEEKRQPLALGEGREQLRPALADANGDGQLDLVVADRRGRLTAYLRPQGWKFGDTIKPSGYLAKSGGLTQDENQALVLGAGIHAIAAGDLNGDGLFDLVTGKNTGRMMWLANKGTKEQPKFETPADLKGTAPTPGVWLLPSQWDIEVGLMKGNFFAYASCVGSQEDASAEPREGSKVLKLGYAPCPNKVMPRPIWSSTASGNTGQAPDDDALFRASAEERGRISPPNIFIIRQSIQLEIGKTYTFSFQAKGAKVSNEKVTIAWRGYKKLGEDRLVRKERGAVERKANAIAEARNESFDFSAGSSWGTVNKQIKVDFKNERELNKEKLTSEGVIEIIFELMAPDGVLYLDDIKLVPSA